MRLTSGLTKEAKTKNEQSPSAAPMTTQERLDSAVAGRLRLNERKEELRRAIEAKDRELDALAESIVSGSEPARVKARELRQDMADGRAEIDATDRVLAKLETQIVELSNQRSAEAQAEHRAHMIGEVAKVEAAIASDLAAFFDAADAMLAAAHRIGGGVQQVRDWTTSSPNGINSDASRAAVAHRSTWSVIRAAHHEQLDRFTGKNHVLDVENRNRIAAALLTRDGIFA